MINAVVRPIRDWVADGVAGWDRFWFRPASQTTLSLIRILAGAMLFYTHLVWSLQLEAFFGPRGWVTPQAADLSPFREGAWSYFFWIDSAAIIWIVHIAALVIFAMLTCGLFTRITSVLAALAAISYANRVPGALFGLDDTNVMIALYLAVAGGGDRFSLDGWWRRRKQPNIDPAPPRIRTNIGLRLLQLHLCIVYLFSGASKLLGAQWWDGSALWGAIASSEYQSLDMTWLAQFPWLMDLATQAALAWEVFYCALIWPRWTRPITLLMALFVHGGIALFLGMKTFGLAMIIANLAFVPGDWLERISPWLRGRAGEGGPAEKSSPSKA